MNFAFADSVCATRITTLRKGPGSQNPASWKVSRYMPFVRLQKKSGWTKVQDLEGEVHWVKSSDITSQIRCVAVKASVAVLHKEPNSTSPGASLKTLDRFTPLKRMDDEKLPWLHVEDEAGHVSWIHESQVWKPVTVNNISF